MADDAQKKRGWEAMADLPILTYRPMQPGGQYLAELKGHKILARADTAMGAVKQIRTWRDAEIAKHRAAAERKAKLGASE